MTNPHTAVYRAVKDGTLIRPDACEACGKRGRVEGHHDDYAKPLEVMWLCPKCHRQRDKVMPSGRLAAATGWHVFQVRLPPDLHERLVARAAEEHRSVNNQVIWLLEQDLEVAA